MIMSVITLIRSYEIHYFYYNDRYKITNFVFSSLDDDEIHITLFKLKYI